LGGGAIEIIGGIKSPAPLSLFAPMPIMLVY